MITDELCGQLAQWYCHVGCKGNCRPMLKGEAVHFENVRVADRVTTHLGQLGFLSSQRKSSPWPFELQVDASEMPIFALKTLNLSQDEKKVLLDLIITYAGDICDLPVTRKWFNASSNCEGLIVLLADSGFATHNDGSYCWTALISSSMRAAYFWDEAGQSVDDQDS